MQSSSSFFSLPVTSVLYLDMQNVQNVHKSRIIFVISSIDNSINTFRKNTHFLDFKALSIDNCQFSIASSVVSCQLKIGNANGENR